MLQIHLRYFDKFYDKQTSYHPNILAHHPHNHQLYPIKGLKMSRNILFHDLIEMLGKSRMHLIQWMINFICKPNSSF